MPYLKKAYSGVKSLIFAPTTRAMWYTGPNEISSPYLTSYLFMVFVKLILYGYKTWSVALRKEPRLRVFESGVLRRILGLMKDEVTRDWRRRHNEELHDLVSQNITRTRRSIKMR